MIIASKCKCSRQLSITGWFLMSRSEDWYHFFSLEKWRQGLEFALVHKHVVFVLLVAIFMARFEL